jgi:hypothetical protein
VDMGMPVDMATAVDMAITVAMATAVDMGTTGEGFLSGCLSGGGWVRGGDRQLGGVLRTILLIPLRR